MTPIQRIRVVLVRPEEPANVGATARVMKNFGLNHLVLVAPTYDRPERAYTLAHGAQDIVESADIMTTLPDALTGCTRAWAATRRRGRKRNAGHNAREAAQVSVQSAELGEPSAWVFGPESRGLATDDVACCSGRVSIPTAPEQPSLNLAQAVAICAYETFVASLGPSGEGRKTTVLEDRLALYAHLETALLGIGFLHPHTIGPRMNALRAVLERAALSEKELKLMRGIARQMSWAAGNEPAESD